MQELFVYFVLFERLSPQKNKEDTNTAASLNCGTALI